MKINLKSVLLLLIASGIWGFAFVAQGIAAETLSSFTITGVRSLIGFVFLFLISTVKSLINKKEVFEKDKKKQKTLIIASIICGVCFAIAYNFQQFGIAIYPDNVAISGRAGFLTGLYVLFVPIIGFMFFKKKVTGNVIISLVMAIIGLYLLCFSNGLTNVYLGDLVVLICGIFFALQIIYVDKYVSDIDSLKFGAYQFLICGILSLILAFIFEDVVLKDILKAQLPLIYLGVFSCAVAGVLQIRAQKISNNPTVDAIVMSFESVFAVIGGFLIQDQVPLINEIVGCVIMFFAIILSQVAFTFKKKNITKNLGE